MTVPPSAQASGAICAVAGQAQREMQTWAAAYPLLYAAKAFDATLYSALAHAAAFSGPWFDAAELRMANRACVWVFGLDWLIDHEATVHSDVTTLVARCRAVARGGEPGTEVSPTGELLRFLADLRDEIAQAPAFPMLGEVWLDDFDSMLTCMAREWEWKTAGSRPGLDDYLRNADNIGFALVLTSHWIFTSETAAPSLMPAAREATWAVQRVIRLLNDLGTYERDREWGDLNALMLDVTRDEVEERIALLTRDAREALDRLRSAHPRLADYMERQMEFCVGFYGITDYWGSL